MNKNYFTSVYIILITALNIFAQNEKYFPEPLIELLNPKGYRVSIVDRPGIIRATLNATLDSESNELDLSGHSHYGSPLNVTQQGGWWIYEDTTSNLRPGQRIYISVNVEYGSYGDLHMTKVYVVPLLSNCEESLTQTYGRKVCKHELIFEDNFDSLNLTMWKQEIRIPLDTDDAEFVLYDNQKENCYIKNGKLHIQATKSDYDDNRIRNDEINLGTKCTGIVNVEKECKRRGTFFRILPPIISARLNTKDSFSFRYGKIEVRAKLPKGDWLVPVIALEPRSNDYGTTGYASGQMRVAYIRGNEALWTKDGHPIDGSYLWGGAILKTGQSFRDVWLKNVQGNQHWGEDFHIYSLTWTENTILLAYDGTTYGQIKSGFPPHSSMAPLDKAFFISLAMSAGGNSDFPDGSVSGEHSKPWENNHPKGELNFFKARDKWYPTWKAEDATLIIDYVKVWAL